MNVTARSYLTAGIAAVGAGAMVLAPVQPIPADAALAPEKIAKTLAVELAATVDPWAAWGQLIDDTAASVDGLHTSFWAQHRQDYDPPFPIFTSILLNQYTYFAEFPDISLIASQFFGNIGKFVKSGFTAATDNISLVETGDVLGIKEHRSLYSLLGGFAPELVPLLEPTTMPMAGALLGFAGPGLGAMLQLSESIQEIINAPTTDEKLQAFFDLAPKVINAGLNGGKFLDLVPILDALGIEIPSLVKGLGIITGGALTAYPYTKPDPGGYQAGGVAFDSLDFDLGILGKMAGIPIGLIGAIQSTMTFAARDIYLTPPGGGAAVPAPAAALPAPAAAAVAQAPAVEDTPAPIEDTPAPIEDTEADEPDLSVVTLSEEAEAPAATGSSKQSASTAGGDQAGSDKGSPRSKRGGRGAA